MYCIKYKIFFFDKNNFIFFTNIYMHYFIYMDWVYYSFCFYILGLFG